MNRLLFYQNVTGHKTMNYDSSFLFPLSVFFFFDNTDKIIGTAMMPAKTTRKINSFKSTLNMGIILSF